MRPALSATYRTARRVVVAVVGGTVLLLGVLMMIGPGPGLLTVAAGLGILGIEFAWARRWLRRVKEESIKAARKVRAKRKGRADRSRHGAAD
ncbi:MAG: PGPGW domain-containing protein [Candidatus Eisenbacteria bacterium]